MAVCVLLVAFAAGGSAQPAAAVEVSDGGGASVFTANGGRGLSPVLLARRDPGARIGGTTLVGSRGKERLVGVPRTDFIHGLGGNDVITAGRGDDQVSGGGGHDRIAGGPGNDLLRGATGNDVFIDGPGDDWVIDRQGATTVRVGRGNDRTTVADGRGDDRVRCSSVRATGLIDADRGDHIEPSCKHRGLRIRLDAARPGATDAQAEPDDLRGAGTNEDPFRADCGPFEPPSGCKIEFPFRPLDGPFANEFPPAYQCPFDGPQFDFRYLVNRTYVPFGTTVPNGVEVGAIGPIGPIAVSISGFRVFDGYAAGTATGFPYASATNWTRGQRWYSIVLHCTYDREASYRP